MTNRDRITLLEDKLARLEARIAALESRVIYPDWTYRPPAAPTPPTTHPIISPLPYIVFPAPSCITTFDTAGTSASAFDVVRYGDHP